MNPLELHVAGATVRHQGPFSELEVPVSSGPLPAEVRAQWVRPLYFGLQKPHVPGFLAANLSLVDDQLIDQLLTHFDWRSRVAGALLVALQRREAFADRIGRLFLRSDVCYAGATYCLALATFNTPSSIQVLKCYLDYYLERKDLWFDQNSAMLLETTRLPVEQVAEQVGYGDATALRRLMRKVTGATPRQFRYSVA